MPKGPNYSEAYPRLDVLQASAAERQGQGTCVFTDETGRILGGVRYFTVTESAAVLDTFLHGPYLRHTRDQIRLDLVEGNNRPERFGRFAKCPDCGRRVQVLCFTKSWACAGCHGLKYRRQLVDRKVLDAEQLLAAERRLKEPRPKGMRQDTFAKRRASDEETVKRLRAQFAGPYLPVASDAHQFKVQAQWVSEAEIRADTRLSFALGDLLDPL